MKCRTHLQFLLLSFLIATAYCQTLMEQIMAMQTALRTSSTVSRCKSFPKVIGGSNGETFINQIDFSTATNTLVAVGLTFDDYIVGYTSDYAPIIVVTSDPYYLYDWALSVHVNKASFTGVAFSTNGNYIIAFMEGEALSTNYIITFETTSGKVFQTNFLSYSSTSTQQIYHLSILSRSIFVHNNILFLTAQKCSLSSQCPFHLLRLNLGATPTFQLIKESQQYSAALGLQVSSGVDKIFVFQVTSTSYYISALVTTSFNLLWNAYYQLYGTHCSHSIDYYDPPAGNSAIAFASRSLSGSSHTIFFGRIKYSGTASIQSAQLFTEITGNYNTHNFKDLRLAGGTDKAIFLLENFVVGTIDFSSQTITYKEALPSPSGASPYIILGRITDDTGSFFASHSSNQILLSDSNSNSPPQRSGFITRFNSSTQDYNCQTFKTTSVVSGTLNQANGFPITDLNSPFTSVLSIPTITFDSAMLVQQLTQSMYFPAFYSTESFCPQSPFLLSPNQLSTPIKEVTINYGQQSQINVANYFSFTSQSCSQGSPTTQNYLLTLTNGSAIPTGITYDQFSKTIMISINAAPGNYQLQLNYIASDGLNYATSYYQTNINIKNTAPIFSSALKTPIETFVGVSVLQILPIINDNEGNTVTVSSCLLDSYMACSTLPSFISYTNTAKQFEIYPTLSSQMGSYTVQVKLSDGAYESPYTFLVNVKQNLHPYLISVDTSLRIITLDTIQVKLNEVKDYPIRMYDPEGFAMTANLMGIPFASVIASTIHTAPTTYGQVGTAKGSLKINDGYQDSIYDVTIVVTNEAPDFNTLPPSLIPNDVIVKTTSSFSLPPFTDPEGLLVDAKVTYKGTSTLPSFISYHTFTQEFVFTASTMQELGSYELKVQLCDGEPKCSYEYLMLVNVINLFPKFVDPNAQVVNQVVHLNSEGQYQIPDYIDQEGFPVIVTHSPELPDFITFKNGLYTFKPTDLSSIGSHQIIGFISDSVDSISYSFSLEVLNFAPYFSVQSKKLSDMLDIIVGEPRIYTLPDYNEIESLPLDVRYSLDSGQSWPEFIKFNPNEKKFQIQPTSTQHAGTYTVRIILSDPRNSSDPYYFRLRIINPLPTNPKELVVFNKTNNYLPLPKKNITSTINITQSYILAKIKSISPTGQVIIRFNTALQLPENLTSFLQNVKIFNISVVPHKDSLPSLDKRITGFNVTDMNKIELTLQVNFSNPLQISPKIVSSFFCDKYFQTEQDTLKIDFIEPLYFVDQSSRMSIAQNYAIEGTIPQQIVYTCKNQI